MSKAVAGTCYIKVDGTQLEVIGSVELPYSTHKRETVAKGFYKEEDSIPFVKLEAIFTPDFPIEKIVNSDNITVTVELKSGRAYVLSGAYAVGDLNVSGDEGKTSIEFNGSNGEWM